MYNHKPGHNARIATLVLAAIALLSLAPMAAADEAPANDQGTDEAPCAGADIYTTPPAATVDVEECIPDLP